MQVCKLNFTMHPTQRDQKSDHIYTIVSRNLDDSRDFIIETNVDSDDFFNWSHKFNFQNQQKQTD